MYAVGLWNCRRRFYFTQNLILSVQMVNLLEDLEYTPDLFKAVGNEWLPVDPEEELAKSSGFA
jgi:hypothetical protein